MTTTRKEKETDRDGKIQLVRPNQIKYRFHEYEYKYEYEYENTNTSKIYIRCSIRNKNGRTISIIII